MFRSVAWLATLAVLVFLGIQFWGRGAAKTSNDLGLTHIVQKGDLIITVSEQGTLESSNNTEIKSRIRGGSTVTWVIKGGTEVEPGELLVQLDTKRIEDAIGKNSTDAFVAKATFERTKADLARAELAIEAYLEGTYQTELKRLNRNLALAKSNLITMRESFSDSEAMFRRGFANKYEVQSSQLAVDQATLELKVRQKEIDVLNDYTKVMELEILNGNLRSLRSKFKADEAGLKLDESRRDKAVQELEYCEVRSSRAGLVIFPSSAEWKETPDVTEGGFVRHDQVMLLMPDLTQMQVKVGIHEAQVDRVKEGMIAKVTLPDFAIVGKVESIASVAKPAGWWTGNMVKYETVINLPETPGLRPGMSAQVDVVLAEFKNRILLPVSAIVEIGNKKMCWIKGSSGQAVRKVVEVGESNDVFMIANSGIDIGDEVVLNPLRFIDDAREETIRSFEEDDSSSNMLKLESTSSKIDDHLAQGASNAN